MAFSNSVDHQRQRIHAIGTGTVTVADLGTYIAARVKDGVYDYDQLLDLSDAKLDVAPHEVIQVVKQRACTSHQSPSRLPRSTRGPVVRHLDSSDNWRLCLISKVRLYTSPTRWKPPMPGSTT